MVCVMKKSITVIILVVLLIPFGASAGKDGKIINLSLPAENIAEMEIDCGAGFLKIRGVEGLDNIEVHARIVAGNETGEDLVVTDGSGYLHIADVDGKVKIHDGSGDISIDGVGKDLELAEAGSGRVRYNNVKGHVKGDL